MYCNFADKPLKPHHVYSCSHNKFIKLPPTLFARCAINSPESVAQGRLRIIVRLFTTLPHVSFAQLCPACKTVGARDELSPRVHPLPAFGAPAKSRALPVHTRVSHSFTHATPLIHESPRPKSPRGPTPCVWKRFILRFAPAAILADSRCPTT